MALHSHHILCYHTPWDRIQSWKGWSLDCCCSLRVDVACPGAMAVISVVRILAHRTWLTAAQKVDKTETYSLQ